MAAAGRGRCAVRGRHGPLGLFLLELEEADRCWCCHRERIDFLHILRRVHRLLLLLLLAANKASAHPADDGGLAQGEIGRVVMDVCEPLDTRLWGVHTHVERHWASKVSLQGMARAMDEAA